MSIYNYKQEHIVQLLEEAKTLGNLAANLQMSKTTIRRLLDNDKVWPHKSTENKIKPFILGYKKIEQLKRPYLKDR